MWRTNLSSQCQYLSILSTFIQSQLREKDSFHSREFSRHAPYATNTHIITRYSTNNMTSYCPVTICEAAGSCVIRTLSSFEHYHEARVVTAETNWKLWSLEARDNCNVYWAGIWLLGLISTPWYLWPSFLIIICWSWHWGRSLDSGYSAAVVSMKLW